METQYNPKKIEEQVQRYWHEQNTFQAVENSNKEKFYCLTMFPYPSGRLHMGHVRVFTLCDVVSRYQYLLGKNVMQPMGWDAFGLPAENAAIKHQTPPAKWTYQNIDFMRGQMKRLGFGYDWSREITTCDPNYYRWEQWFFLKLYEKGLVYRKNAEVNWDPVDQTVLANEQVVDGRGWRSGALVERREIPQWFFKITAYADQLLNDLDQLPHWPDPIKTMQRNWIGRSEGVEVKFGIQNSDENLIIFTTRPDTLFGVTYIAIAPQHPIVKRLAETQTAIHQFVDECKNIKTAEAEIATIEKRGIATDLFAIHPITQERLPIWIANFVLMEYGSGAVMSVPAHDQRDFEFAQQYQLPIKQVILPSDQNGWDFTKKAYTPSGELIDSAQFTGLTSTQASRDIIAYLEHHEKGSRKIHFRLRDWGISRQRYWGAPIPIIYCEHCGAVPVSEKDLPVILPENVEFTGITSPLKNIPAFYEVLCPQCQQPAHRETDTFDTFFESSWYYARFACKKQDHMMLDGRANYWVPVDQYIGGAEHAVLHLLYARFIHKTLRDLALLNSDEPFIRLLNQGHVLNQGTKMSKSKGNIVDPDGLIDKLGADTVRLFIIFASPPEQSLEWSDSGIEGAHRFLKKLWTFAYEQREKIIKYNLSEETHTINIDEINNEQRETLRNLYEIVDQIKYDYERLQFNTVVSGCMKIFNLIVKQPNAADHHDMAILHKGISLLLRLLSPVTPHITHQLWQDLHYTGNILNAPWPKCNAASIKMDQKTLVVQVNGKLRTQISVPAQADEKTIQDIALNDAKIQISLANKQVKKIIVVPGRLVNIVVSE